MADDLSDYEKRQQLVTLGLLASEVLATDTVRELLIESCHSSTLANQFFKERLGQEGLLDVLIGLAIEEYSGDAQMTASYWMAQFPAVMLASRISKLELVAANEWDCVAVHARRAIEALRLSA